jgi:hypothetical protein
VWIYSLLIVCSHSAQPCEDRDPSKCWEGSAEMQEVRGAQALEELAPPRCVRLTAAFASAPSGDVPTLKAMGQAV